MGRKILIILFSSIIFWIGEGFSQMPQEVRISMDFKEASLKDVLKIFSQQAGLNFIASHEIEDRKITLYLDRVSVEDALNRILQANNLTYEQPPESNIIIIKEVVIPEVETITRIYSLNYAKAEAVKDLFEKMREKREEARARERGVAREPIKTAGLLTEYGKIVSDVRTNSIIVTDIPPQFPIIEETLAKLDAVTPQVMIEAELLETTLAAIDKLGIEWSETIASYKGPIQTTKFPFRKHDFPAGVDKTIYMAYGYLRINAFAALKLLQTDKDTKLLARPRVLTLNNETAQIDITAEITTQRGTRLVVVEGIRREEPVMEPIKTGIVLKVTPQINEENYITMLLEPSVTTPVVSPYITDITVVDPHTRAVKTSVRVRDGDTLVIGGLLSTEDTETMKKVPLLGDIPLLGHLFKSKSIDKADRELIMFITPHIFQEYITPVSLEEIERESTLPPEMSKAKVIEGLLNRFNK